MTTIPQTKQKNPERILVWDKTMETIDLRHLLEKHLPLGFEVDRDAFGSSDDHPTCTLTTDYDLTPVICDDPRAGDQEFYASTLMLSYAGSTHFSDFGAVLARVSHANVAYVFPRLHWTQQRKRDVAVFFYTDDRAELGKPLDERFQWISEHIDALAKHGMIYDRQQIEAMIKEGSLFERVRDHHLSTRVLIVEPNPIRAAKYEGILLGKGKRAPYTTQSYTEASERATDHGLIVANLSQVPSWESFAREVNETSPDTMLAFYSGDTAVLPLRPILYGKLSEEAGVRALFLEGNIEQLLQYDTIERIAQHGELRREFKKAGVFDALQRLEREGTSYDNVVSPVLQTMIAYSVLQDLRGKRT